MSLRSLNCNSSQRPLARMKSQMLKHKSQLS